MFPFSHKISRLMVVACLPLFLISNTGNADHGNYILESEYDFSCNGLLYKRLKGNATFLEDMPSANVNVLTISMSQNGEGFVSHTIEFMISKKSQSKHTETGKYKVKPVSGFLENFEGVFGVVDLKEYGEKPFFTTSGYINITSATDEEIAGELKLWLSNGMGGTLQLQGPFNIIKD